MIVKLVIWLDGWRITDQKLRKPGAACRVRISPRSTSAKFCRLLGASEVIANLYCNCVHLYWELMKHFMMKVKYEEVNITVNIYL